MSVVWDNPLGHNLITTRRCGSCGHEVVRTLWSRPIAFAGGDAFGLEEETPLAIPDVTGLLRDAPFRCRACDGIQARLVAISLDESGIPF